MRRCQHFCGCEGNAVGRDPDTGLMLCAGCLGRSILGTDCSRARKYFGHVPMHFVDGAWTEPPPLRDGDCSAVPEDFAAFLTIRTGFTAPAWDFMPLARAAAVGAGGAVVGGEDGLGGPGGMGGLGGLGTASGCVVAGMATNPQRPPKDPPPGPLPPPPGRPVQPNPPRR